MFEEATFIDRVATHQGEGLVPVAAVSIARFRQGETVTREIEGEQTVLLGVVTGHELIWRQLMLRTRLRSIIGFELPS